MGRSNNTRIINKFEFWSVADCACEFCINYTKDQPCPLDVCCIENIRQEAIRREQATKSSSEPASSANAANNGGVSVSVGASDSPGTFGVSDGSVPDGAVGVIGADAGKEVALSAVD